MGRALKNLCDLIFKLFSFTRKEKEHSFWKVLLLLYFAFVLWAVLFKFDMSFGSVARMQEDVRYFSFVLDAPYANFVPFKTIAKCLEDMSSPYFIFNFIGNFVPFVPLGALLPMAFRKMRSLISTLAAIFGFTLFAECFQYFFRIGYFDVDDLILNFLAGALGFALYLWFDASLDLADCKRQKNLSERGK